MVRGPLIREPDYSTTKAYHSLEISGNTTFGNLITEQMEYNWQDKPQWLMPLVSVTHHSINPPFKCAAKQASPYSAFVLATALFTH